MENNNVARSTSFHQQHILPDDLPPLLKKIKTRPVSGFDMVMGAAKEKEGFGINTPLDNSGCNINNNTSHSISLSMPSSPSGLYYDRARRFALNNRQAFSNGKSNLSNVSCAADAAIASGGATNSCHMFHSQPIRVGNDAAEMNQHQNLQRLSSSRFGETAGTPKDKRFDPFKTWSGRLERQLSNLRGRPQEEPVSADADAGDGGEIEILPVERYFDALEGPELDTLKASEVSVLPEDQTWPFLLRFPISSFGICLGVGSQAILWKKLATSSSMSFLDVSLKVNLALWYVALALFSIVFSIYALKVVFYFEAVRREYYHPVRVNFFFAPWITCLFLALGLPPSIAVNLHPVSWYVLMTPILCLELKIYGQWMSGGQRRLSKVANPSNHLSIVGNFVGALLGASMGLKEGPIFFFAIGLAHYTVLFVTLYQRLPTNESLPKELHPVFFLFVAAPSVACTAWAQIHGDFDYGSRIPFFIALFLYFSLAVRINFFIGFKFSLAWWAYTFPMTGASIATIRYSMEVTNCVTQSLSIALSVISTLTVMFLLATTVTHAFVLNDLFPNDISIAITETKQKTGKKRSSLKSSSSDDLDLHSAITVNILGHHLRV